MYNFISSGYILLQFTRALNINFVLQLFDETEYRNIVELLSENVFGSLMSYLISHITTSSAGK